ncbi:MAG: TonB-dependent receptor [Tannerella sp.]|jgi:TonB-linked SusC/RagA family outer membrane protein|nr:TonB-dependent receptor [Tannerella sp.]
MTKLSHLTGTSKSFPYFIVFLLALYSGISSVQAQTIQGVVLDNRTSDPIIGATVLIKGEKTNTGTITDIDGKFEVGVSTIPTTIVVSYIGYKSEEIDIYEKPSVPVQIPLQESYNTLSEVVVIGYGTQKRSELTGSVASVAKHSLEVPATSFDNLLSGSVAGVQVTQSSGQPGASASIRIRGGNSITGGNEPLYVIDGQIIYNNNAASSAGISYSGAGLNALATINPADIESIDVLKDASATAIYGSRGANGVILVTTKKGRGKDKVRYTGSIGQSQVRNQLDLLNAKEWAEVRNDIAAGIAGEKIFTQEQINAFANNSYNYQDEVFRTSLTQNHQLSLSGGDEKTQYFISGNYSNQDGVIVNSGFERYSLRTNLTRKFSDKFKTGLNISVSSSKQTGFSNGAASAGSPNALVDALLTSPVVPVYEEDGSYHYDDTYQMNVNTIANLKDIVNETKVNRTFGNFFAEYKIVPELTAKVNAGADLINTKQNYYAPYYTTVGTATNGRGFVGNNLTKSWQTEFTLTYDKTFNDDHHLTALAGYTTENTYTESAVASATNFLNNITGFNDLSSGDASPAKSNAIPSVLNSWLGRVNYTYLNRYNATVSFRADGSSRFPVGNQWGYFPSLGLSWNVYEEDFLKNTKPISNLKLRLSAGSTGNQEINDFQYIQNWSPVLYGLGGKLVTGYAPQNLANPELKWETTTQYNAGFDLGLLNNRINLVFDAYYKLTNDLLVEVPLPTSSGYSSALENIGSVSNKGVELTVNVDVVRGKQKKSFNWQSALVIAHNQNRVESLGEEVDSYYPRVPNSNIGRFNPLVVKKGYALGTFWGYKSAGIVQTGEDLVNIPKPSWTKTVTVQPGDRKYVDSGGESNVINEEDRVVLGDAQPKFTFGFTNTFSYKGFDLTAVIQGSYGNKLYNAMRSHLEISSLVNNSSGVLRDRWTATNPSNTVPRAQNAPSVVVGDWLIEDASYARLKTATLGYTLPKSWTSQVKIEWVRLFVTGQNLFTLTKYTGYDPEVNTYEQQNLYQGIDFGSYPSLKGWLAGLEITF